MSATCHVISLGPTPQPGAPALKDWGNSATTHGVEAFWGQAGLCLLQAPVQGPPGSTRSVGHRFAESISSLAGTQHWRHF